MNVADAMTPREDVVTVELPGTRDDVLEYLQERGFSSVPVVKNSADGEEYRGLVSREELIERLVKSLNLPKNTLVFLCM